MRQVKHSQNRRGVGEDRGRGRRGWRQSPKQTSHPFGQAFDPATTTVTVAVTRPKKKEKIKKIKFKIGVRKSDAHMQMPWQEAQDNGHGTTRHDTTRHDTTRYEAAPRAAVQICHQLVSPWPLLRRRQRRFDGVDETERNEKFKWRPADRQKSAQRESRN